MLPPINLSNLLLVRTSHNNSNKRFYSKQPRKNAAVVLVVVFFFVVVGGSWSVVRFCWSRIETSADTAHGLECEAKNNDRRPVADHYGIKTLMKMSNA